MSPRAAPFARVALALAALLGTTDAALAQEDLPHVISPLTAVSDPNGVNLVDGRLQMDMPLLSIPAAPHLRYDRIQNAAPYESGVATAGGSGTYSIHAGTGTSDSFRCVDADCVSVTGSGSTFRWGTNKYRQSGSGAEWTFNVVYGVTVANGRTNSIYYAGIVRYPNGETITYSYDTAYLNGDTLARSFRRPVRIESSLGYFISIAYQSNDLNADINGWQTPLQVALAATAAPSSPISWLTYSGDAITLHGPGETSGRAYHCTGCNTQLGGELEVASGALQLPAEGAAATAVSAVSGWQVVGSVTRDGVGWTYAYDNLRSQAFSTDLLYDHLNVTGPNAFHNVYSYAAIWVSLHNRRLVLTGVTDSIGRTTTYGNDEYFRPVSMTQPGGNQVAVGYDDFGNIIRRTVTPAGGGTALVESAHYMTENCTPTAAPISCYRADWSRDAMGRQTDYAYNDLGQLTEQVDPTDANGVRRRTSIGYEAVTLPDGQILSRRNAVRVCADTGATCGASAPIQTEYDYAGPVLLPTAERRIDGATTLTTTYSYDAAGRLIATDGPLPGTGDATYNRYDVHGRRTWEIGALALNGLRIATRTTYRESDDKPVATETGTLPDAASTNLAVFRRTDLTYDSRRYPVRETLSASGTTYGVTDTAYDDSGRLVCTALRMNPAAFGAMPGACALTAEGAQGPDRITVNLYDAAGQLLQEQRASLTGQQANYATYGYSPNGRRTSVTDANNNRAELRWDGFDRQSRWIFPSPTTPGVANQADYEEYGYDAVGNRTSLRKRDGSTLTYSYDNLNRMIVKIVPERSGLTAAQTRDFHYGYDLGNRQLYARFDSPAGEGVTNAYDAFGRLTSSGINLGGIVRTLAYQYDLAGNRIRITHPDGHWFGALHDALNRQYYLFGEGEAPLVYGEYAAHGALAFTGRPASATWLGYDAVQRPASRSHDFNGGGDVVWAYAYNPAGQIAALSRDNDAYAWTGHYAADRNYVTNGLNQYTAAGGATFGYDANGNLTSDGSRSYLYDVENRLVANSNGAALAYDPLGRLFQVTSGAGAITRFLYDGDALALEYDGSNTVVRRHLHWQGADVPVISYEGAGLGTPRHLFADHQGSIVALADGPGFIVAINAYDEYGIPSAGNSGRFQYTGQAFLAELGLYYYKGRMYSPTLGRFLQTDPIGYDDQINLYAYVANDPVNRQDPSGEATVYIYDNHQIVIVQTFDNHSQFTNAQISARAQSYSGTTTAGDHVVTTFTPGNDSDAVHLRPNPSLNDYGANRSHIDRIGGRNVEIAPNAYGPETPAHEIGHGMGAGDQYVGGVDAQGHAITVAPPGAANSIMGDLNGPANRQTLDEIVRAPTNTIKYCILTALESHCE